MTSHPTAADIAAMTDQELILAFVRPVTAQANGFTTEDLHHALYHYGIEGGFRPDDFTNTLMHLMDMADPGNMARLTRSFPEVVAARQFAYWHKHKALEVWDAIQTAAEVWDAIQTAAQTIADYQQTKETR